MEKNDKINFDRENIDDILNAEFRSPESFMVLDDNIQSGRTK